MGRGVNKGPGWARPRGIKAAEVGSGAASQRVERGRSWGRGEAEGVEGQGGLGACGCRKDRTPRERCWEDGGGGDGDGENWTGDVWVKGGVFKVLKLEVGAEGP